MEADPISKRVLTVFDPSKDSSVNIEKLSKNVSRPDLDTFADYLKIPLVNPKSNKKLYSNRETLAKRIVLEIRSLYPTSCSECTEEYTVMQGCQPKTRCWICLQGAHDCEYFTAKMEVYITTPVQLNGMVWLCSDCTNANRCIMEYDEPPSGIGTPGQSLSTEAPQSSSETVTSKNFSDTPKLKQKAAKTEDFKAAELAKELEREQSEQERSESKPNTCTHVCPRFQEGSCPHGISGKKAADGKEKCDLFHPKRCFRYMRHYTHDTRGCKEGDNCAYLHINLCKSSIETKKCKDVNCKHMHLTLDG